jgi:hypothetical protein
MVVPYGLELELLHIFDSLGHFGPSQPSSCS